MSIGWPLWWDGTSFGRRPALDGDSQCDVAIVGGGFSGLWLAYWLSEFATDLDIVVVERDHVGFGASGRNGGWASALLPVSLVALASSIGDDATVALQTEMFEAVREIDEICSTASIDCDFRLGGTVSLIRNAPQRSRAEADLADYARFGFSDHVRLLDPASTRSRVAFDGESVFRPDCAVIHPRRLVDGLARVVEARGVHIVEDTTVTEIGDRRLVTSHGDLRARFVIDCREAFGAASSRRRVVPIYSLMIATERLGDEVWSGIGLADRETFTDHRHQLVYGQRTADGRLAFGGRGVGYHFGSRVDPTFDLHRRVHDELRQSLVELFPILGDVEVTHRWGGPLAAPRDWTWTVSLDLTSGVGILGGYTGDGVTSSFVAGRAMARAILESGSDFPLFGHRSPRWEPEPLRWIAINAMTRLAGRLDDRELTGRSTGLLGRAFERLLA